MAGSNIENIIDSVLSGRTGSLNQGTNTFGMEGSRFPRQKLVEILEELGCSSGKSGRSGREFYGDSNWSERMNVKNLSDEDIKEVLAKLMCMREGENSDVSGCYSSSHPHSINFLNTQTFNKLNMLNTNEIKQFICMWVKQITFDLVMRECPQLLSSTTSEQVNIDKNLVKKVLVKFIDLVECHCERHSNKQTILEVLRQVDVFEIIEQSVHEIKVWNKICSGYSRNRQQGGDEVTELLVTLIKEVLKRREGGGFYSQRSGRMDYPRESGSYGRRSNSQLIDSLLRDEECGSPEWGRRTGESHGSGRFFSGYGTKGDSYKKNWNTGCSEDELEPIISMLAQKLRKSSGGMQCNEDAPYYPRMSGGSRRYGQRYSEPFSNSKIEQLSEMLRNL